MDGQIGREREAALARIDAIMTELKASPQYSAAAEHARREAESRLGDERAWFGSASDIGAIRLRGETVSEQLRPELYNYLDRHPSTPAMPQSAHGGQAGNGAPAQPDHAPSPSPAPRPRPHVITMSAVARPEGFTALRTKDDVDEYLDAYRRRLIEAIENGNEILL